MPFQIGRKERIEQWRKEKAAKEEVAELKSDENQQALQKLVTRVKPWTLEDDEYTHCFVVV